MLGGAGSQLDVAFELGDPVVRVGAALLEVGKAGGGAVEKLRSELGVGLRELLLDGARGGRGILGVRAGIGDGLIELFRRGLLLGGP